MVTVATVRATVAGMLVRDDLNDEIDDELIRVCTELERVADFVSERAECEFATVATTTWYSTVDLSSSSGYGTNSSASLAVSNIIKIDYMKLAPGSSGLDEEIRRLDFHQFQQLSEGPDTGGWPVYYTIHAGRIGLWPVPQQVYTVEFDGFVKPVTPTTSASESVYFDEYLEYCETLAAGRICLKYLSDFDRAQAYMAHADDLRSQIKIEGAYKQSSGRIRSREY